MVSEGLPEALSKAPAHAEFQLCHVLSLLCQERDGEELRLWRHIVLGTDSLNLNVLVCIRVVIVGPAFRVVGTDEVPHRKHSV